MMYDPTQVRRIESERRGKILELLLISAFVLSLVLTLLFIALFTFERHPVTVIELFGLCGGIAVAWGLARAQYRLAAAHVYFACLIITGLLLSLNDGVKSSALLVVYIPIVAAPLLLRPIWSFVYAGIALAAFLLVLFVSPSNAGWEWSETLLETVLAATYFGLIALISYLSARGYERMLDATAKQAVELDEARATLELRVEERTSEVRLALHDLQRSAETIRQLSVPIMPIGDGVLLLPLVGSIDTQRAEQVLNQLLETLHRERAHTILLDVTGVPVVDTQVARVLMQAAQATRLLGAAPILVGLRAEVAQTLVGLGLDLGEITALRDVRDGLARSQRAAVAVG